MKEIKESVEFQLIQLIGIRDYIMAVLRTFFKVIFSNEIWFSSPGMKTRGQC
jgi:hypothetical protein